MLRFVIVKIKRGRFVNQHRWYLQAENGKKIATSGEALHNISDVEEIIREIQASAGAAEIVYQG